MFTEDPSAFMVDFGLDAIAGAESGRVLFDQPDEKILGGRGQSRQYEMTYAAADFPTLEFDSTVVIDAVTYRVIEEPMALDDGVFKLARLERPA